MLLQNELQGYIAPVAGRNTGKTRRKLFQGLSRFSVQSEKADAPTVKRNGQRLITDAVL